MWIQPLRRPLDVGDSRAKRGSRLAGLTGQLNICNSLLSVLNCNTLAYIVKPEVKVLVYQVLNDVILSLSH